MRITRELEFEAGSRREKLPFISSDFPYVASRAELDYYEDNICPWHWHDAVELFYVESGSLTYFTPHNNIVFKKGDAGFVNSNVLHMTEFRLGMESNITTIHLFEPSLIAGLHDSAIARKYITPVVGSSGVEIIRFSQEVSEESSVIGMILSAFSIEEDCFGYEIKIRDALSDIWLKIFQLNYDKIILNTAKTDLSEDRIKKMMIYIHEHYQEKLSVSDIADSAFVSERECYRIFGTQLHMTPSEYIQSYRIQVARQLLAETDKQITEIGYATGLGTSSYFGKVFKEHTSLTPLEYRRKWQNNDII